ncbi:MAG: hypothetical protein KIS92_14560 [Planctomycetota bacterium]|nr:hypothetical protein [Planctomycetota bacterium]
MKRGIILCLVFVLGCSTKEHPKQVKTALTRISKAELCLTAFKAEYPNAPLIPSTVIDNGVMRDIPYQSYKSDNFEFNIYGDPDAPIAVEMGVYPPSISDHTSHMKCLQVLEACLSQSEDRVLLASIPLREGKQVSKDLTLEVTPSTAEDAYGAWWVSIYFEKKLEQARASKAEIKEITIEVPAPSSSSSQAIGKKESEEQGGWNQDELFRRKPSSYDSGGGGRVYVRGYTRKDGTYVRPHTRSRPRR